MDIDLDGPVHFVDYGGPAQAPSAVYVHGLGGSHINWSALAPLLGPHVRGLAVDLPGFGGTPAAGRNTAVPANTRLLGRFLAAVTDEPVVLVGNSMGALISMMVAAEQPELVKALVLLNPTLPLTRRSRVEGAMRRNFILNGVPVIGEWLLARRYARVPAAQRVAETLARCCVQAERVPVEMVEQMVALEAELTGRSDHVPAQLAAARSIVLGLAWPHSYWRLMRAIQQPVLLLHGTYDRLVSVYSARRAARRLPHWTFVELESGHTPQMEMPDVVADEIVRWLSASGFGPHGSHRAIHLPEGAHGADKAVLANSVDEHALGIDPAAA